MANVRLTMRKIREVLRLHFECDRNQREIADAVGTSTTTVWHYLRRTRLAGLSWPLT
ncbi:winged helix-turn-helix transcriptional regulator, partial [Burkholderia diffusa]